MNRLLLMFWLAVVYLVTGKLSLLLALPPGYATAIFPPAGIGLVCLVIFGRGVWPGIMLGSTLMNFWVSIEAGAPAALDTLQVAAIIGTGASLQAYVGAWLVSRFVKNPYELDEIPDIARFLILGGPISCCIAASVGVYTLHASGIITSDRVMVSWFTWWIGDSIGVVFLSPVLMSFIAPNKQYWHARRGVLMAPLSIAFVTVVILFFQVNQWENHAIRTRFEGIADGSALLLKLRLERNSQLLGSEERFFQASNSVSRDEFQLFNAKIPRDYPGIQAMSWNPRVARQARETFEADTRSEGYPEFHIVEKSPQGDLIPALPRDEYFPVHYVEPLVGNESAVGFDVISSKVRKEALQKSMESRSAAVTARFKLLQETQDSYGLLLFQPVIKQEILKGFVVAVLRMNDIVDTIPEIRVGKNLRLLLLDRSAPAEEQLLFGDSKLLKQLDRFPLQFRQSIQFGQRQWEAIFVPAEHAGYVYGWQAWAVLVAGLMVASLLGIFLLVLTGRSSRVERLVEERTLALGESESRNKAIVDHAVEGIVSIDAQGRVEFVNQAAVRLFGYQQAELLGKDIRILMPFRYREAHQEGLNRYLQQGGGDIVGKAVELEGLHKNGDHFPMEISISEINVGGRRSFTALIHDIRERKKIDRMKSEFISTVSHELRTPLTSIRGTLGLLEGGLGGVLTERGKSLMDIAIRNLDRLTRLINNILDIEKIESGKMDFETQFEAIGPMVAYTVESCRGFAGQIDVCLELTQPAEDLVIELNEDAVVQVLTNLISNAVKFSPKKGVVKIKLAQDDGQAVLSVQDEGPGIPLDMQDKIFEKFVQVDSSDTRKYDGTGLGLTITKLLTEKMKGSIQVKSQEGSGAVFTVRFPLRKL